MTIPQEAIEAAAAAIYSYTQSGMDVSSHMLSPEIARMWNGAALAGIQAALPALERQIREQVAQEIWEARNRVYCATPPTLTDAALKAGYAYAYRIAQGRD